MPFESRDDDNPYAPEFDDEFVRRDFVSTVYFILSCQLLFSFGMVATFVYVEAAQEIIVDNPALFWVSIGFTFVCLIALVCCEGVRRNSPLNIIVLFLFTLCMSFLLSCTAIHYAPETVLIAVGITAVVCLALTIFAFQTAIDFTTCGGVLFVALILLIILGVVNIFFPGRTLALIYSSMGAILFSFYLIYDTQLMMGGKHQNSISPDEYILAALSLYIDIINIFLFILSILGILED